jgi:hypothetical protein
MPRSLLLLVLLAVAACHRVSPKAEWTPCNGQQFFLVSSRWDQEVEVYAWVRGRSLALGTVGPYANAEFPLPAGASGAGFRGQGNRPIPTGTLIGGRYVCR